MDSWVNLLESNADTTDLDADFNIGSLHEEEAVVEISPPVKGKSNKKRSKNFNEKEDILLASAWLEVTTDAVQSIDQTRSTYWQRIVDYYHKHKTFESERNLNSLTHRWSIISASVSKFCGWYDQIILRHQSGVTEQDRIQQACVMYKENDQENKSFVLMHCWHVLRHAQKWQDFLSKDDGNNNNNKKHKTSSNASPRSSTPGTNESRHVDEEDGPSHTSPSKGPSKGRPDGQKKEKEKRGKNSIGGEPIYMQAMENLWSKREKADELKEIMKKERNDMRLALEARKIEVMQETEARKIEVMQETEARRLQLMQQTEDRNTRELALKERMEDEKIMNMDLSGMSELRQKFYITCQEEIIARRLNNGGS